MAWFYTLIPLTAGWAADLIWGDPERLPHPVVGFGKVISFGEKRLNRGHWRRLKGGLLAVALICATFGLTWAIDTILERWVVASIAFRTVVVFYCLAGTTLVREVRDVFLAADRGLDEGRRQVSRIVGRDTCSLSDREVRIAALETLAENLSDGVIAPLFWFALGGVPAMMAYKMVNTLDSMIGYRTERYARFGTVAARIDDAANWIPARLTAALMAVVSGCGKVFRFILQFGNAHASPNSGYPEAALAGYLDCRFGGAHDYFGERVEKPHIGTNERDVDSADMVKAVSLCRRAEIISVILAAAARAIAACM